MAGRRKQSDQLGFDWEAYRRERFQMVDAIEWTRSGHTQVRWNHVAVLLKGVHAHSDLATGESHVGRAKLANWCKYSTSTLDRARMDAEGLGVLELREQYNAKGRTESVWCVRWDRLATLGVECSRGHDSARGGDCQVEDGGHQPGTGDCQVDEAIRGSSLSSSLFSSPPPNPHDAPARASSLESRAPRSISGNGHWQEVVEEVFLCGVNQATRAVNDCRTRGATVDDVRGLIAFWRQHEAGWQQPAYVLYLRLRRHSAGMATDAGWLPWSDEYSRNVDAATRRAKVDAELAVQLRARHARHDAWASLDAGTKQAIRRALVADYGHQRLQKSLDRVMKGGGSAEVEETLKPFRAAIERELARPHEPRVVCIDGGDGDGKRSGRVVVY